MNEITRPKYVKTVNNAIQFAKNSGYGGVLVYNVMANKNNLVFLDDLSLRFSIFYFHLTKIQKTLLLYMWYGDGKPQQFSCCYYFPINSNIKKYKRQEVTLKLCTSVPQGFVRYLQLTANAALACVN